MIKSLGLGDGGGGKEGDKGNVQVSGHLGDGAIR